MRRILCIAAACVMLLASACAEEDFVSSSAAAILEHVPAAGFGHEWDVLALAKSGNLPEGYGQNYLESLRNAISQGEFERTRPTTAALCALCAMELDAPVPAEIRALLEDESFVVSQGANGCAWALMALSKMEVTPGREAAAQACILALRDWQLEDGGFALRGENADADVTAMAIQGLAGFADDETAGEMLLRAWTCLAKMQLDSGGFASMGSENCESCAQAVLAYCAVDANMRAQMDIAALEARLLSFACADGGFSHETGGEFSLMATRQAVLALGCMEAAE